VIVHLVDLVPFEEAFDPVAEARAIVGELRKYDEALYEKPRWLVLNKIDMVPEEERVKRVADFIKRYKWKGPVFEISALTGQGCEKLCYAIYDYLAKFGAAGRAAEAEDLALDPRFRELPAAKNTDENRPAASDAHDESEPRVVSKKGEKTTKSNKSEPASDPS